jgi:hypothetical protein
MLKITSKRPLLRWTIGNVSETGIDILQESIAKIKELYNDRFDLIICYNSLTNQQLSRICKFNIPLYQQNADKSELPYPPKGELWKLCPPRLKIKAHELFLDNDLVMLEKIPEIDEFLDSRSGLLMEARCRVRLFGQFANLIPTSFFPINTGLFGIPPYFNFTKYIHEYFAAINGNQWKQDRNTAEYDDQGLISSILANECKNLIVIRHPTIFNYSLGEGEAFETELRTTHGIHFVGANVMDHPGWKQYPNLITSRKWIPIHN